MVDFAKLHADWYAGLDKEARARVDASREKEANAQATAIEIEATFERYATKDRGKTSYVAEKWTKPVTLRIEEYEGRDGETREVIAFVGAVTGYEKFTLDESLAKLLSDPDEKRLRPEWAVCGGSLKYNSCRVSTEAVEAYVRRMRPHLFEAAPVTAP